MSSKKNKIVIITITAIAIILAFAFTIMCIGMIPELNSLFDLEQIEKNLKTF